VVHTSTKSGACRLTHSARTSTGRGTRRRGNPVRTGTSSGSVRLSDQAFQPKALSGDGGRRVGQDQGFRCGTLRREPSRRTGSGSMDDVWFRDPAKRHRAGAARIQPNVFVACHAGRTPGPEPQWPSPNPDLARGRGVSVRRSLSSPRSILVGASRRRDRSARGASLLERQTYSIIAQFLLYRCRSFRLCL